MLLSVTLLAATHVLFDGASTAAWKSPDGSAFPEWCWRVENKTLKAVPMTSGFRDLVTAEQYGDFELSFEWKLPSGGNSGVKYQVQRPMLRKAAPGERVGMAARGFEYQLVDTAHPDASDPKHSTGSLYRLIAPLMVPSRPLQNGFHTGRIIVRGDHVEHWLDGAKVVDYQRPDLYPAIAAGATASDDLKALRDQTKRGGRIALQHHQTEVWFRNIVVKTQ